MVRYFSRGWLFQTATSAVLLAGFWVPDTWAANDNHTPATAAEMVELSAALLPDTRICHREAQEAITAISQRPEFASATWGIVIQPLADATPLYSQNAENFLIPASNIKLLTTAAALEVIAERSPENLPELKADITVINRDSNNNQADALLREIGGQGTVRQMLTPLGVDPNTYIQADGSGLSRENRVQPSTFVTLLAAMQAREEGDIFYESLAIAGVSGTLRNRFRNTPVQGRLHAKTGTLNGVRALSGYLETDGYGTVIFSIVVNQPGQSGSVMLTAIDEMILQLSQLETCP